MEDRKPQGRNKHSTKPPSLTSRNICTGGDILSVPNTRRALINCERLLRVWLQDIPLQQTTPCLFHCWWGHKQTWRHRRHDCMTGFSLFLSLPHPAKAQAVNVTSPAHHLYFLSSGESMGDRVIWLTGISQSFPQTLDRISWLGFSAWTQHWIDVPVSESGLKDIRHAFSQMHGQKEQEIQQIRSSNAYFL